MGPGWICCGREQAGIDLEGARDTTEASEAAEVDRNGLEE